MTPTACCARNGRSREFSNLSLLHGSIKLRPACSNEIALWLQWALRADPDDVDDYGALQASA